MTLWTIATPDTVPCAEECLRRALHFGIFQDKSSVKTELVRVESKAEAHIAKIAHWGYLEEPAWFFDADCWMIRHARIPVPAPGVLIGNPDNTPFHRYDKYQGFDKTHAINTSLVGACAPSPPVRRMAEMALDLQREDYGTEPTEDEKFLNVAAQRSDLMVARLSTRWNWCGEHPPASVIAIHAAGRSNKFEWLTRVSQQYDDATRMDE